VTAGQMLRRGSAAVDEASARAWISEQRDNAATLSYKLPSEAVGQHVVVTAGLAAERRRLIEAQEAYRRKVMVFVKPADRMKKGQSDLEALRERDAIEDEVADAYQKKFGLKKGSTVDGLLAYCGKDNEDGVWMPFHTGFNPVHVGERTGTIEIEDLPQDASLDLFFYFNVRKVDDRWNYAPINEIRVKLKTNKASWAIALEQAGLSSLVEAMEANQLISFDRIASVVDNEAELRRLEIDDSTARKLSELIARRGFVTQVERERLQNEKEELAVQVNALNEELKRDKAQFYIGQLVESVKGKKKHVVLGVTDDAALQMRRFDMSATEAVYSAKPADVRPLQWQLFLSHSQRDAANQVQNLHILLKEAGVASWYDMDAEKLEAIDMIRGIRDSKVFCVYLTEMYFTRYFCRLESTFAKESGKPVLIIYEPDFRHGGGAYTDLVDRATNRYPEFREWLLSTEAIPMARRAFQRQAMIQEILKRLGVKTSNKVLSPGGSTSKAVEAGLRQEISDLKEEINKLWDVVETLQDNLGQQNQQ